MTKEQFIESYMTYVLEEEKRPLSVYKFCKSHGAEEESFYKHFGSFKNLELAIWESFVEKTVALAKKNEAYEEWPAKEKLLTFYFTLFGNFGLNRSYLLFILQDKSMKGLAQLKGLKMALKPFFHEISLASKQDLPDMIPTEMLDKLSDEGLWIQFLSLLKFWLEDDSQGFEETDAFIEKSVRVFFDIKENPALKSMLDYGKFLGKQMNRFL